MVLKLWLRVSLMTMFLLAGCVKPTPTPTAAGTQTPVGYPGYPPTATSEAYPANGAPATAPAAQPTPTSGPYPAPTAGAAARLVPL